MRKIIIPFLFVCSMSFGQMFSAQNAESNIGCDTTATDVTIGTQTWMRKNLAVVRYNDNTGIPKVTDNTAWSALTTPAYCWYNNDSATYAATYGALYNWYAVNTGKLCPTGYHVPDTTEWMTLINYLGGASVAGGKLKEVDTTHWSTSNTGASDSVCFTGLPGGYRRDIDGLFYVLNSSAMWWSSTQYLTTKAMFIYILNTDRNIVKASNYKPFGYSVRCIKD